MSHPITSDGESALDERIRLEHALLERSRPSEAAVPRRSGLKPLSFAQEGIWFYSQWLPKLPLYVVPLAFRIRGKLNVPILKQALSVVAERQEALRTKFVLVDGMPMQGAYDRAQIDVPLIDLSGEEADRREARLIQLLEQEAQTGFSLGRDWLIRPRFFRLSADDHVMSVMLHHIIADRQSANILLSELSQAYNALNSCGQFVPAPLAFHFSDMAAFERRRLNEKTSSEEAAYWKSRLSSSGDHEELFSDFPRPAMRSFKGRQVLFKLSAELTWRLKDLGREQGVTLHVLLLAALKTLLHRYSNSDALAVGIPITTRDIPESEELIGCFVNLLPLRTRFDGAMTFAEFLRQVHEASNELYAHRQMPFLELVKEHRTSADLSRHPFFQITFQFMSDRAGRLDLADLEIESLALHSGTAKFDLTLIMAEDSGGLVADLEYSTELFAAPTIDRFTRHFKNLLEAIVSDPSQRIANVPFLTAEESALVVEQFNRTETGYPRGSTIHELFEAQCAARPDGPALRFEAGELSYGELNRQANRLARRLQNAGVQAGDRVGLCVNRSPQEIVGLLAILKAGACYVPLDSHFPRARLEFLVRDADIRVVLTVPNCRERVTGLDLRFVDITEAESAENSAPTPCLAVGPENPCYILYTSGSTGDPKGVIVPHRAVIRLVRETNWLEFRRDDVLLRFAPLSFDASTLEIWGSLLNGATLAIFPETFDSIEQIGTVIERFGVRAAFLTTALLHEIIEQHLDLLEPLERVITGGEVLSSRAAARFLQRFPQCQLVNGYGPTENTTFTTCYTLPPAWSPDHPVPIGKPIANTTVFILDRYLNPAPVGVPGELFAGGDGLALGYLNQPALTAERFVSNPFCPGSRLYRTGDLARWLPDGTIEFLGRRDNQVKIRGFRVELDEIEQVLRAIPSIESAVVLAERDASGENSIRAWVIAAKGQEATESDIRRRLAEVLPPFMAPARITLVEAFPLSANGKVDRKALAQMGSANNHGEATSSVLSEMEQRVAEIWKEVLQRSAIGRSENFFQLGGQSLLATRIISRINHEFRRGLPLSSLFEAPTIAELTRRIEMAPPAETPAIRRRPVRADGGESRIEQFRS